jgi:hypothetical protein
VNVVRSGILLAVVACSSVGWSDVHPQDLDRRIGAPQIEKYRAVRDAREWKNPMVVIRPDSIEVVSEALANGRVTVPVEELRAVLIRLPLSAWPYGRVVGAQDASIIGSRSDLEPIARNHLTAEDLLQGLGVAVWWWPS